MARMETGDKLDGLIDSMAKFQAIHTRSAAKRIVMAGADADVGILKEITERAGHVRTGSMMEGIRGGEFHETLGGAQINVYPQGTDGKGASNTVKAFVINYGRGRRKKNGRMGDKFITAKDAETEEKTLAAMRNEAEKILAESGLI